MFVMDEHAGWMGTEEGVTEVEHAEPEAGFGVGLRSGQAVAGLSGGRPGADCGFGEVVGAVAGAGRA